MTVKTPRPAVEELEERCVPVTWGNPWPDATHLTLSFAPDGTAVGDQTSTLHGSLDAVAARAAWQEELLRAFQTWAVQANINIGLVPDGGQAFGVAGRPQGDARFGDVRVAAYGMASDVLAIATPFESTAGTWAGDVKLNTSYTFGIGRQDAIDLFSVLLHKAGHVFGMDHAADPNSPLYEIYQGIRSGLSAGDVTNIQALYGARTADRFEGTSGNDTLGTATRLNLLTAGDGSLGVAAEGDLRTLADRDVFRFTAPLTLGPLVIDLRTEGISLLTARITVYDSLGRVVRSAATSDPTNNDLGVRIDNPALLGTYYVKVESGRQDVFGVGSYRLEVKSLPLVQAATGAVGSVVGTVTSLLNDDLHTNDTLLTASLLGPVTTLTNGVTSRFDYAFTGSVRDSRDVDYYRVTAPGSGGANTVMSVMLWGTRQNGLVPRADVYDALGRAVASEVLVNADGVFTLQVEDAKQGAGYYVRVEAQNPDGPGGTGNYFLGVDFGDKAVRLDAIAAGNLDATRTEVGGVLVVPRSEMMHLVLSASGAGGVRMTVSDASGNVLATLDALAGRDPVSLTRTLTHGRYLLEFETLGGAVAFTLRGSRLSDPIGPKPQDATTSPSGSSGSTEPPPDSTSSTTYPGSTESGSSSGPPPSSTSDTSTSSSSSTSSSGTTTSPEQDYYDSQSYEWYYWGYAESSQPRDPYSDPYAAG